MGGASIDKWLTIRGIKHVDYKLVGHLFTRAIRHTDKADRRFHCGNLVVTSDRLQGFVARPLELKKRPSAVCTYVLHDSVLTATMPRYRKGANMAYMGPFRSLVSIPWCDPHAKRPSWPERCRFSGTPTAGEQQCTMRSGLSFGSFGGSSAGL